MAAKSHRDAPSSEAGSPLQVVSSRRRVPGAGVAGPPVLAAAICSMGAGAVHAATVHEQMDLSSLYGWFFVAMAVGQIGYAAVVAFRPGRALAILGAAGNAGVLALWILSRTVGVPVGPEAGSALPVGFADVLTAVLEGIAVLLVAVSFVPAIRARGGRGTGTLAALGGIGAIVTATATLAVLVQLGVVTSIAPSP